MTTPNKYLSGLAAALDDGTSGQVLTSTGSGGVAFADAGGSGVTTHTNQDAMVSADASSAYTEGSLHYDLNTNKLFVKMADSAGAGFYQIAAITNTTPTISSPTTGTSFTLDNTGNPTTISITASDDDVGQTLNYYYTVSTGSIGSGTTITTSATSSGTYSSSGNAVAGSSNASTNSHFRITPSTSVATDFSLTFYVTDGTNIANTICSFSLSFIITDSHYTTLLMATDGSAGDNDTITYDTGSTTGNSFTQINSDIYAGTFSPYRHGGYSAYFDGNGAYLSTTVSTIGTGAFTFECYANFETLASNEILFSMGAYSPALYYRSASSELAIYHSSAFYTTGFTPQTNTWYHIAMVRESNGDTKVYVNGEQKGTTQTYTTNITNTTCYIGYDTTTAYYEGWISDARLVVGTAVYTGNFTPPTERLTAVTNTELLTCNLPYIADTPPSGGTAKTITVNGNISTKPFGPYDHGEYSESINGGSILIDTYNKQITLNDSNGDFALGATETTIKLWYYPMDADATYAQWLLRKGASTSNAGFWGLGHYSSNRLRTITRDNGGTFKSTYSPTDSIIPNTWNYIEWYLPTSGNTSVKLNGTEVISTAASSNYGSTTDTLELPKAAQNPANGLYYADLQFVKGDARESSVPTAPMSTNTNAKLHVTGQQGHVIDKSQGNNLKLIGNAAASTTQAKFSNTASLYLDGTGDYVTATGTPIGSGDFTLEAFVRPASFANYRTIFTNRGTANASTNFVVGVNSSGQVYLWSSSFLITSSSTLSANTWHHVALVRNGTGAGSTVLYIDGSSVGSANVSNNFSDTAYDIGGDTVDTNHWNGYIQDLRVSIGKARYTSNFTVPSSPLKG